MFYKSYISILVLVIILIKCSSANKFLMDNKNSKKELNNKKLIEVGKNPIKLFHEKGHIIKFSDKYSPSLINYYDKISNLIKIGNRLAAQQCRNTQYAKEQNLAYIVFVSKQNYS
ncbi:MAG: hypothetical protein GY830_05560 [Bacteroidetes bacterium]|nr:hypothetical protein [Bacteroidota bacterium]